MREMTWLCLNCNNYVGLDRHGRCERCRSEAVAAVLEIRREPLAALEVAQ